MNRKILQIIDANLNRTREGLRVCEDIVRFSTTKKDTAKSLKALRHSATNTIIRSPKISFKKLIANRDTHSDILKNADDKKLGKNSSHDLFMSNIQRVKESLRVLEECCRVIDKDVSQKYRKLRFKVYDLEKRYDDTVRAS